MSSLLWLLFLPLGGAVFNRLLAGRLAKPAAAGLACGAVGLSFLLSARAFLSLAALPEESRQVLQPVFEWAAVGQERLAFQLLLDPLSAVMILLVTGIGFLIHVYSAGYMAEESTFEYGRYFAYLNFFIFSMLTLVLASNFLVLFAGWELVGLSSYLLIGFYRSKTSAANAGKKAFIVNRIGDFGFLLGIFIILGVFGSLEFAEVLPKAGLKLGEGSKLAAVTALLLFMGAMGKSAQVPLHVWLPDAMEGPTPVSALIHAATMVTAGVFLVARCHAIFLLSPEAMSFVAWTGAFTAVFAASVALVQNDIKRVMAYSTLSQLGYMMLGVGVGAFTAGFFHLFTHAFFKALLFLGCGSVMHALAGELDVTKMGGLRSKMPVTYWTFLVGALCLIGFPGTSGFFSKDEILYQALVSPRGSKLLWTAGVLAAAGTALYVARLFFKAFHGQPRDAHLWEHAHESGWLMTVPLLILAALSLSVSFLGLPHFLAHGFQSFERWLAPVFRDAPQVHADGPIVNPWMLVGLYTSIALAGIALGWAWFGRFSRVPDRMFGWFRHLHQLLWRKYYVDELYDLAFVRGTLGACHLLFRFFERAVVDGAINALARLSLMGGELVRSHLHTGFARAYASAVVLGAVLLLWIALRWAP